MFKGLAHPVRVRILEVLSGGEDVPVTELMRVTGLEPSHLSQHLSVLRRHGLVRSERRGSTVYYRLAFDEVADLLRVARILLTEVLGTSSGQLRAAGTLPSLPAR